MDKIVEIAVSAACTAAGWLVTLVVRHCDYAIRSDDYVRELDDEVVILGDRRVEVQRQVDDEIKGQVVRWEKNAEEVTDKARRVLENDKTANKTCCCRWLPNPVARYCIGRNARKTAEKIQELLQKGQFERDNYGSASAGLVDGAPRQNPSAGDRGDTFTDSRASIFQGMSALDDEKHKVIGVYYESAPARLVDGAPRQNPSVGDRGDTITDSRASIFQGMSALDDEKHKVIGVYYESAPAGLVGGAPRQNPSVGDRGDTITDSRASIFQGIMSALDDEKHKVIGIYGAGGVGKTTLLKEVEKKFRKEGKPFHMIAYSKVSQKPDLKNIQNDIAYAFGVKLGPAEVGGRDLLSKKLKEDPTKKVLIILDDLWDKLDLEAVGIPSGDESAKCKLLLTSRDKRVLQQMGAHEPFHLKGLSYDEAFRLFEETYGDELQADNGLKAKAAQVVAKVAGSPLLIKSVASTLKCGDESTWDTALIKIEDPNIKSIVEWSYGRLKSDETESLFLLCGFVGGSIPVELLLGLGMGLGLFEGFDMTIQSSRSKLNEMLRRLRSTRLLQDGSSDEENVTIHDLYSEEVISTPLTGQNTLMTHRYAGSWPKKKLEKCWVCLVNVGSKRLAELRLHRFPDLEILMLLEQRDKRDCDGLDFTCMKELRVLYLRSMNIAGLPSWIEILRSLQSLYLDNCCVEDVTILGKLKALQILSFARSSISSLPKEIGELSNLKSLNLSNCEKLQKIEPGAIEGLINLEELYMRRSFDQWMGEVEISSELCNAKLAELKSLKKLNTLEISIRDPIVLLEDGDLSFENLIRFWINIGNAKGREFEGLTTVKLKSEVCNSILSKGWVQTTLQKTQYLHFDGLSEFEKSTHELCIRGFPKLKHLDIQNCSSIEYIFSSSNGAFPILESLFLENLNLAKICDGLAAPKCFSKLKTVKVTRCNRLEYMWCLSHIHMLAQLEEIQVYECDSMRAIVIDDVGGDIAVAHDRVELPNVHRVILVGLPKMMSFCIEAGITSGVAPIQVWFPRLESLMMDGPLDHENILYNQHLSECNNLKSIEIRTFQSTSSVLIPDWILKLPNLESLKIHDSSSPEVVFDLGELKLTGHMENLSRLATMWLFDLPNLHRMWKRDVELQGILVFQRLNKLKVNNTGLAFLFPVSVAKCLRKITDIEVWDCRNMEALVVDEEGRDEGTNDIIEFPELKYLWIIRCPMERFISYPHGKKKTITATSDSPNVCSDSFFNGKVSLPSLWYLRLHSVGSFKRIWHDKLPKSSFYNLAKLEVSECSELLNVFPSTIIERLHNLSSVGIYNCPSLESVFECGSLDSNTMEQTGALLPKLRVPVTEAIRLSNMEKSDSEMVLDLPNLEEVNVQKCSKLRYLFPYVMAVTRERLRSLKIEDCEQMKEVAPKEEGGRS